MPKGKDVLGRHKFYFVFEILFGRIVQRTVTWVAWHTNITIPPIRVKIFAKVILYF